MLQDAQFCYSVICSSLKWSLMGKSVWSKMINSNDRPLWLKWPSSFVLSFLRAFDRLGRVLSHQSWADRLSYLRYGSSENYASIKVFINCLIDDIITRLNSVEDRPEALVEETGNGLNSVRWLEVVWFWSKRYSWPRIIKFCAKGP